MPIKRFDQPGLVSYYFTDAVSVPLTGNCLYSTLVRESLPLDPARLVRPLGLHGSPFAAPLVKEKVTTVRPDLNAIHQIADLSLAGRNVSCPQSPEKQRPSPYSTSDDRKASSSKKKREDLHCVRCHTNFSRTGNQVCVVPHVFPREETSVVQLHHNLDFIEGYASLCCDGKKNLLRVVSADCKETWKLDPVGKCFIGKHTTIAEDVNYNNINILPCFKDLWSCRREVLDDSEGILPVFGGSYDARIGNEWTPIPIRRPLFLPD